MDRDTGWNNADFHNQLLSITGASARKPISFLYEVESTLKTTMLLAGTEDALFALNVGTGNYRVLTSDMGGFKAAAQNQDTIVLTNDFDRPQYWVFDGTAFGSEEALSVIPDLETLGITKVGVVVTFRYCTFYMNLVENGRTFANKILWSDADNALSLFPGEESIAGSLDLDTGESILAAHPLANSLLIYTTRGIWEIRPVGGEEFFAATKRYDPGKSSEAVLAYPRSLVSTGETHVYAGQSGIYEYSFFEPKPKLIEWVHKASLVMFDELDKDNCDGPVAGFDAEHHHIWISWVPVGATLPARSLVLNSQFPFASIVDHGFTAFCQFMPREPVTVFRDWILENCICTEEEMAEEFPDIFENEGGYCEAQEAVVCEDQPDAFYTTETIELEDGIVMEDFNAEAPSENSLCSRMAGVTLADLCRAESQADQCNAARLFVMASAGDFCLKQTTDSYYREVCVDFDGCGEYEQLGYKSILRSGPLDFKNMADEKILSLFVAEISTAASTIPAQVKLRVGASAQALDPNVDCGILWQEQVPIALECQGGSEASHAAGNTRPDNEFKWPVYWLGRNLYYELEISNPDSDPIDTGGACCFSRFVMQVKPSPARY